MRSLQRLLTDQQKLRETWQRSSPDTSPKVRRVERGTAGTIVRFGRVDSVVQSDPTYGPHLTVYYRHAVGIPPQWQDSTLQPIRCHIAPGRQIADYSTDQIVRVLFLEGIVVAEPLA
jgi:hypothetical protein